MPAAKKSAPKANGSPIEFEAQLWAAADKLRGNLDGSEYKHVALGLIDRIISSVHKSRSLAALRDALLPKLLSGEVRAPVL